ncbi:hypothetical protein [Hymenobacter sediminicola]|uniref:Capsule assembly Wzi family protein n=1 Tax=Hymenobacter sediminicola TaxID=2761579 RepID=A0A7G7W8U9_9BACT|nr:hypothetical protein [Hymenobacter sediminicola]QNH62792.1 hypothetical protein H4317_02935 [Hymenobacter sediminicola]
MKKLLLFLALSALLTDTAFGQSMSLKFDGPVPPADSTQRGNRRGLLRRKAARTVPVAPVAAPVPTAVIPSVTDSVAATVAMPPVVAPAPVALNSSYLQGVVTVPLDPDVYRLIDRYAIKYGSDSLGDLQTAVRPYARAAVARLAERMLADAANLSVQDRFNAEYLLRDNWNYSTQATALNQSQRPVLKHFYQRQTDLYSLSTPDFTLRVNPVLGLAAGKDSETDGLRFLNTRGLQVEGVIDQRLGFYTFLADNQMAVPLYAQQRIRRDAIVPHEGYWKDFKTIGGSQYDFFSARGYITYAATKHINVQLGHDRNVIGNGYRSLILSDYSAPYFFLKLNTRIWKLNYQNLFTEMTVERTRDAAGSPMDTVYQKKYLNVHHLSYDVTPNFNVGVYEAIVFARRSGHYELQYLNPIIFYRAIEQQIGSGDNAILGLDFKWNIRQRVQLYGQLVLDEFVLSQIRSGNGWWANKQAFQLGGKYVDVAGIRNLDVQAEFNYIRPYTYEHEDQYTNFQHYQQPLAHPMGANLYEMLGIVSYQPVARLQLTAKAFYTVQGLDRPNATDPSVLNYGGNVLLSYNSRVSEFGNTVGQGNQSQLLHTDFTASYQPRQNVFLDAKLIMRRQSFTDSPTQNTVFPTVALRWNIVQRLHEF